METQMSLAFVNNSRNWRLPRVCKQWRPGGRGGRFHHSDAGVRGQRSVRDPSSMTGQPPVSVEEKHLRHDMFGNS